VPQCAEEASNFWRYLRPDEPDPSPAGGRGRASTPRRAGAETCGPV